MYKRSVKYYKTWWIAFVKGFLNALPFYKHDQYAPFIILGHPRTGTSLLHTYLNSHPSVFSLNEVLKENAKGEMIFKFYTSRIKNVGFKFFYEFSMSSEKMNLFHQFMKKKDAKIIKIVRSNYLKTFVSLKIAEQTNQWSRAEEDNDAVDSKRIKLSKEELILAIRQYKRWEMEVDANVKENNIPVHIVEYTDLVENPDEVMLGVQAFLKVSPKVLSSLLVKQNPEPLSELIVDFETLKKEFEGTEFHAFFIEA